MFTVFKKYFYNPVPVPILALPVEGVDLADEAGGVVMVPVDNAVGVDDAAVSVPTGANGFRRPGFVAGGSAVLRSVNIANAGF